MRDELLRRNARAGVGDLDDAPCRRRARVDDRQPAALRHRVARVEEQVQEHLLQLVLDALHDRRAVGDSSLRTWMLPVRNWCSSSDSTSLMTALRSTGPLSTCAGRARLSRPLTIFAARNVCRSIFSSTLRLRIVRLGALAAASA